MERPGRVQMGRVATSLFLVSLLAPLGFSCAGAVRGADEASLERARGKAPDGAAAFERHCAQCHGSRGESVSSAPPVLGAGALPEYPVARNANADPAASDPEQLRLEAQTRPAGAPWRDPFRTADDLLSFVSKRMPRGEPGSLAAEEYTSIVNFMLVAQGVPVPPEGVTPANAKSINLKQP